MCEGETAEKGKLETVVRGRKKKMPERKEGWEIVSQMLRTLVVSIALIVLVPFGLLYLYKTVKSMQAGWLAREYLTDTYDFQWKFGEIEYYTFEGQTFVEVFPEDVRGMERFEIYVYNKKVITDTFIKEYTQIRLEELLEGDFKEIWGEESEINVAIHGFAELDHTPLRYSVDTPLKEILRTEEQPAASRYHIGIELEREEEAEAVKESMWSTILFLKEADVFPDDRELGFSVTVYTGDEREKRYSVENIWEIAAETDLDWKCKEYTYETGE